MPCCISQSRVLALLFVLIGWSSLSVRLSLDNNNTTTSSSSSLQHHGHNNHDGRNKQTVSIPITVPPRRSIGPGQKRRLVIAGVAKDCEKWLEPLRRSIVNMLYETRDVWDLTKLVIYENDSTDATAETIRSWNDETNKLQTKLGGKVELISESWNSGNKSADDAALFEPLGISNATALPNRGRTVRLARARNRLLSRLRSLHQESPFDYVLMLDMDEINVLLMGVQNCFTPEGGMMPEDANWGACCANQWDIYYDLWALRTSHQYNGTIVISEDNYEEWLRCDIMVSKHCAMRFKKLRRIPAYRHISAGKPPIPVRSCFGGATVYDFRYLAENVAWYGGIYPSNSREYSRKLHGQESVEHILFHDAIYKVHPDFTMYIQPKMINAGPIYDPVRFPGGFYRAKKDIFDAAAKSRADPELKKYYPQGNFRFKKTRRGFVGI